MNDLDNNKLLDLYPNYTSVLGPYKRKDGRKHIVLNNSNASKGTRGKTKTISYPKALSEVKLGKRLEKNETVDHHDRNFLNDDNNNLKIKDRAVHASEDAIRLHVEPICCPVCDTKFIPNKNQIKNHHRQSSGPYCSSQCLKIFKQKSIIEKKSMPKIELNKTYFRIDKD